MESKFGKILEISSHGTLIITPDKSGLVLNHSLTTGSIRISYYPDHQFQWIIIYNNKIDVFCGYLANVLADGGFTNADDGFANPELKLTTELKDYIEEAMVYIEDYYLKGCRELESFIEYVAESLVV